jgi:hypothetical protein
MTKPNSRVWLIIALLSVLITAGVGQLLVSYERISGGGVVFLPIQDWHFGREPLEIEVCTFPGSQALIVGESVGLGPLRVSWLNRLGRAWRDEVSGR